MTATLVDQAFALDPLAGRGDLHDTEAMAAELLAATARWLPQFAQLATTSDDVRRRRPSRLTHCPSDRQRRTPCDSDSSGSEPWACP